ncbi:dCTP pyrophosphatase 1-like [Lytechinus pictus]|uniref:dCTP pyrophosphatase 1-like n=1 Tax=Lytechinus pictus TaxID=7653 RepID=UPI0030B9CDC8
MSSQDDQNPSGEDHPEFKFSSHTSLEDLRAKVHKFAEERDWDQYHTPRNLLLAMIQWDQVLSSSHLVRSTKLRTMPISKCSLQSNEEQDI